MDPNEEEDKKKKKKGAVDYANQGLSKAQQARNTYRAVSGGIKAARGLAAAGEGAEAVAGAAATSEVWVPILVIVLIILLVAILFFFLLGGAPSVNGGIGLDNPIATESAGLCTDIPGQFCNDVSCATDNLDTGQGTCPTGRRCCAPPDSNTPVCGQVPKCESGNYLSCLTTEFGIKMAGSYDSTDLKKIYNGFAQGFRFPTFLKWFKSVHPTVTVSSYSECPSGWCTGAWATVVTGAKMTLYQNFLNSSTAYQRYILVHEAGHMAAQANSTANNTQYNLYQNAYTASKNRSCYNSVGIIDTYPWHVIGSGQLNYDRKVHESWAESVANTVLCPANTTCPSHGGGGVSIYDFPQKCSYIYNYVVNKLGC